jgi:hypothetical protein
MSSSLGSTRFSDDMRASESFLQRIYAEVAAGKNTHLDTLSCTVVGGAPLLNNAATNAQPSTGSCLVLGRLLTFDVNDVDSKVDIWVRYILSADTNVASGVTQTERIKSLHPLATDEAGSQSNYNSPWGTKIIAMEQGATAVNSLAIIRSPESGELLVYNVPGLASTGAVVDIPFDSAHLGKPVVVKVSADGLVPGRTAQLCIGSGQGQNIIQADMATPPEVCS